MLDIALILAVFATLLVIVALSQPLAMRLKLSPVVLLAVIGVAIGSVSGILVHGTPTSTIPFAKTAQLLADLPLGAETFIYIFLPVLVFEAAMTSEVRRILEDAAPILMLAIVASLVTTAIVGFALWPLAGLPLVVCLLLGSVVSTTDPAAVIAIFRDVGAPARLRRLVEGEALLNDAAAIVLFSVLLGMVASGRSPDIGGGAADFLLSFFGGTAFGILAGRFLLMMVAVAREDRLAEATLTVAFAYLCFIVAERLFHVSGIVAVLASGLTLSATGRARITPHNWEFLTELWAQLAFWAHSLVFVLASILVPKLLLDMRVYDVALIGVLVAAALGARLLVLFGLLPVLSFARLTEPISTAYKLTIVWGGLRGALTLVLALAVTENQRLPPEIQRFVAVLATGLVLFTLLVNGTTLRPVIHLLGLDQLSPVDQVLRDRVLALSYAEMGDIIRRTAKDHQISPRVARTALLPYELWIEAAAKRDRAEFALSDRERLAIGLVAVGNQERMLALEMLARRAASPSIMQALLRNAEALVEGARSAGRLGYKRAVDGALSFPLGFRLAYFLYRRLGVVRLLADRLGDRFEVLLATRLLIQELLGANAGRSRSIFGERVTGLINTMLKARLEKTSEALDALRRQYPDYATALETRFLRQAALRREMGNYQALYEEGLIAPEVYEDLKGGVAEAQSAQSRPRFDIGLDTRALVGRFDLFAGLDDRQLDRVQKLLRPRFTVPGEVILRKGERGDAVFFIASGAVNVMLPGKSVPLGSGDVFGEMALLTGDVRRADVVASTYCRLLVLRKGDFEHFMQDNRDIRYAINRIAESRSLTHRPDEAVAAS
jgi:CPA1 family monovalent cation:H+ antiporter